MKVYTGLPARELRELPVQAQRAEALGFDGISFGEIAHDVFLMAVLALEHTQRIAVGTSVALAFPRSPTVVAYLSWDLQRLSRGRFELGLGTQVKGHIERRFSIPWAPPGPRMQEYVQALRAIWSCWQTGKPLGFQGKHYSLSLMPPEFNPGPIDHPHIPVYAAALGPAMCRMAGQFCDGILLHSFNTHDYIQGVVLPMIGEGARRAGRSAEDVMVTGGGFIVTGPNEQEVRRALEATRRRISFYASTRTYKSVMDMHGWGDICLKLHEMSLVGQWDQMPALITDAMLGKFCIAGIYDEIAPKIKERYRPYASRISLGMPADPRYDDRLGALLEELRK